MKKLTPTEQAEFDAWKNQPQPQLTDEDVDYFLFQLSKLAECLSKGAAKIEEINRRRKP